MRQQQLMDDVRYAFGARFGRDDSFQPANIRAIYDDESHSTVVVLWESQRGDARR